jgi:hypothetical protein
MLSSVTYTVPMAVKAKYEVPLQVVETKEMRDRIIAIADAEEISQAQVIRDILAHGIEWREREAQERGLGRV